MKKVKENINGGDEMKPQEAGKREESFRERSKRERRQSLHGRGLIITNAAIALGIIIVVLAVKAVMLDAPTPKEGSQENGSQSRIAAAETTTAPTQEPTQAPTPEPKGKDRWIRKNLDASKPMVALTFDDGPYTKVTERILKALQKSNGRATFFVVGSRVDMYKDTLSLTYQQGNQIGSHTYDHKDLSTMTAKKIKSEINRANKQVSAVIGVKTTALRPPYGNVSDVMRKTITTPMFYWSVDSEDWKSRNADNVVKRCKKVQDGDIILMHDLYPSTAEAVERLAPYLTKKGFQLVTIDELFYYKKIETKAGKVYYSAR